MNVTEHPQLKNKVQQHPFSLVFATISGAHLYGFASPDSDFDLRGTHVLPLQQVIGLAPGLETIDRCSIEDGLELDLVTHDITKFMLMMLRKNGYVLEQMMSPLIVHTTPEHQELCSLVPKCLTKHHIHHYLGFAETQWKLVLKSANEAGAAGPRVKPLLYLYRVLLTGIHLMRAHAVECNLEVLNLDHRLSYIPDLLTLKKDGTEKQTMNRFDHHFHQQEFERLKAMLRTESERSSLADVPSAKDALNDLLIRIRLATNPPAPS